MRLFPTARPIGCGWSRPRWQGRGLRGFESGQPQRTPIKGNSAGTSSLGPECSDERVGKRTLTLLEGDHGGEDLLLALDDDSVGLQQALNSRRDVLVGKAVTTLK